MNCDLGEGYGNDHLIMPYITSCNIACGGHAGSTESMQQTLLLAKRQGVRAGAHPSYPDRENFGRNELSIRNEKLFDSILSQVKNLVDTAREMEMIIHHLKPHGALYNKAAREAETATIITEVAAACNLILYAPCGSVLESLGWSQGLNVWSEAFLDRNYNPDLSLVSRDYPDAVLTDSATITERFLKMLIQKEVITGNGKTVTIEPRTYCVHGDQPETPYLLKSLRKQLLDANIQLT